MSLKPTPIGPVPELTAYVARAAFPDGNPYLAVQGRPGHLLRRRTLRRPVPRPGTAGGGPLAAGPGHGPAVRRGARRPPGRRRRPRPHRLEVRPGPGADRPRLRLLRPLRVPRPPHRRRCRAPPAGGDARDLQGPRPGQGPHQAAHRLDPRPGRHPHAQPPGAGRRDAPRRAEQPGDRGAAVAAGVGPARVVRPLCLTGSRSRACPRARRPATPTARPSAPTASGCSRPSTARTRRGGWARCRPWRSCGGSGWPSTTSTRAGCAGGRPATCRRRGGGSTRRTTPRRPSATSGARPGPATRSTSPRRARTTRST